MPGRWGLFIGAVLGLVSSAGAWADAQLVITSSPPVAATVAAAYTASFVASGGVLPYQWTVIEGALPAGLTLNAGAGLLSGTPESAGTFQFGVLVEDSGGAVDSAAVSLQIQPLPLAIATMSLPFGVTGLEYPQQAFEASGGTGAYTFSIPAGTLPPGLTFASGVIGGTPSIAGTSSLLVTVTDASGATATTTLAVTIRPSSNDITLGRAGLSFTLAANAAATPSPQRVAVQSTVVSLPLNYTATAPMPFGSFLTVAGSGGTPDALSIGLNAAAPGLPAGTYTETVVVTCTSASCMGKTQNIAVSLTVTGEPPRLRVPANLLAFSSTPDAPNPAPQSLAVLNAGSGVLTISSISCAATWCGVSGVPATITAGAPSLPAVTVTPVNMTPGYYTTVLTVVSLGGSAAIPVTLRISPGEFNVTPRGAQFRMIAGLAPGNPKGSFQLAASGVGTVNWTASVLPGAAWLQLGAANLGTASGSVAPGKPIVVNYTIGSTAAALAPQTWFATVRIAGSGVVNSPKDFQVLLTVMAPANSVKPEPSPAGLVFVTNAGASPPNQSVQVFSASKTAAVYSANATTFSGGGWLAIAPTVGLTSASSPDTTAVGVTSNSLAAGIYRGAVTYSSSAAGVRTVNVTLVVRANRTCTPSVLAPTQIALVDNFSVAASWPVPLQIRLFDDCGNPVVNGQIVATFSNGDAPLPMTLSDAVNGIYSATWTPGKSASQVNVTAHVSAPGFSAASLYTTTAEISGAVLPNAAPSLASASVLHVFNPQVGAALAPGAIVQIYGSNLASQAAQPASVPLPVTLNGTSVTVGGVAAPLYYVGPGQIDAQIPFELSSAAEYEVVVSANGALTGPQTIQMAPAVPGLAVYSDGSVIAQHQDGSLITRMSPAVPGEYAVLYLAGMGATDNPVGDGAGSPGTPLAHPTLAPSLTIGGAPVPVLFAGLTPGLVGLYQINFQIPANAGGTLELEVSQGGIVSNSTIIPVAVVQ
jgi:uncharacterized protein (TIGR03437 family)